MSSGEPDRCSCGVAPEDRRGEAYNEEAFRHLLEIERRRAALSRRSSLLLLVHIKGRPGATSRLPPQVAEAIFSGIRVSVREVDFAGWFRDGRVAGAVLTQGTQPLSAEASRLIGRRITDTLSSRLPTDAASRLHVRVLQLRPPQNG